MSLPAPTIASTGQAAMQSVQPMHTASSIRATRRAPVHRESDPGAAAGRSSSAARATTVASPPGGQRLIAAAPCAIASSIGAATVVAAAPALRLRQQRIDALDERGRGILVHAAILPLLPGEPAKRPRRYPGSRCRPSATARAVPARFATRIAAACRPRLACRAGRSPKWRADRSAMPVARPDPMCSNDRGSAYAQDDIGRSTCRLYLAPSAPSIPVIRWS